MRKGQQPLKMYHELASWWPLLSSPTEYAEEAELYEQILTGACARPARTLLELGSGGGNNASYLKERFRATLVDLSDEMLRVSRERNPECEHLQGDMRRARLGRTFDCVMIHDAIVYMTSEADLRQAMETAFVHCVPGGAAIFAPDHVQETFEPSTSHGGFDGEGRSLRYLEWTWDPDPADCTYLVDFAYMLREGHSLRVESERHTAGLFARDRWLALLSEVGFEPSLEEYETKKEEILVFVGRKPGQRG